MLNGKNISRHFFGAGVMTADHLLTAPKGIAFASPLYRQCLDNLGGKLTAASQEAFDAFYDEIDPHIVNRAVDIVIGGSTHNVLRNLAGIFRGGATIDLWTPVPAGELGERARKEFAACDINLLSNQTEQRSLGYVRNLVLTPEGQKNRTILKELGCAVYDEFNSFAVPKESIAQANIILQGSMLQHSPDNFEQIYAHRNKDNQIFLALPTDRDFVAARPDVRERMKEIVLDKAAVVSANKEEFEACFECKDAAPEEMQKIAAHWLRLPLLPGGRERVMLITDGAGPSYLVSQNGGVTRTPYYDLPAAFIVGTGDATFAGLIAGFVEGLPPEQSARLAVMMGALKANQLQKASYVLKPMHILLGADLDKAANEVTDQLFKRLHAPKAPVMALPPTNLAI